MEQRRNYLKKLESQSQQNQNQEERNAYIEDEITPKKAEERINRKNIYLQRLLSNHSNSPSNSIRFSSINESLPSLPTFTNNLREIFTSTDNKQKAINYLIKKRSIEQYGSRSPMTDYEGEESNPVLSNKFFIPTELNNNKTIMVSKNIFMNSNAKKKKNMNNLKESQNQNLNSDNFDKNQMKNTFFKKKFNRR